MEFSDDQQEAIRLMWAWQRTRGREFRLGGLAGTGKTTLISHIADKWDNVAVAALAGKAASVLRKKGVQATTIHSLIYAPEGEGENIRFNLKDHLGDVRMIVIDEASMVCRSIYDDLRSFNLPILFVGDHGQLEPVGEDIGLMKNLDFKLEKIHRQAAGNPILRLAHAFREGREREIMSAWLNGWRDEKGRIHIGKYRSSDDICRTSQIICGYNKTRHAINRAIRKSMGFEANIPEVGELLICLRNNREYQVFNGQQATVLAVPCVRKATADVMVQTESGQVQTIPMVLKQFGADTIKDHRDNDICLYDFGYCLTAHKAQGSEWDEVIVVEELADIWDSRRWRYTVATRAKEKLTYLTR